MPQARPTGITLPLRNCDAAEAARLGTLGAELGYESVWVSEVASYDAIAVAAVIASRSASARIGTAIIPVSTRSAALLAMGAATLESLAPGRAIVGIGVSTPLIVSGWHGASSERPLTRMREALEIAGAALRGERTSTEGRLASSEGFELGAPPASLPRLYVGALGPKMRALAESEADGIILNFAPFSRLRDLATGACERSGRDDFETVLPVRIRCTDGLEQAERRFRREIASYMRVDAYARWLTDQGRGELVESVAGDLAAGAPLQDVAEELPGDFIDDLAIIESSPAAAQARLERIRDHGVTPLIVPIIEPGDHPAFEAETEALARSGAVEAKGVLS